MSSIVISDPLHELRIKKRQLDEERKLRHASEGALIDLQTDGFSYCVKYKSNHYLVFLR